MTVVELQNGEQVVVGEQQAPKRETWLGVAYVAIVLGVAALATFVGMVGA